MSIALTDPNRREVAPGEGGNDDPSAWTWAAAYDDPVGAYTVTFSTGEGGDVVKTFTVAPIEGPFGVVQRLADAVAHEDWNGAASIDRRIAADLATLGELKLANEYTVFTD